MRNKENKGWKVNEIDVEWYRGRDHQVVNPHRDGKLIVELWTGQANSSRKIEYKFAAGDVLENKEDAINEPEDKKVAWLSQVVYGGPDVTEIDEIPDEWIRTAEKELAWLGFETREEAPTWHFEN